MELKLADGTLKFGKREDGTSFIGNSAGLHNTHYTTLYNLVHFKKKESPKSYLAVGMAYEMYNWFRSPFDQIKLLKYYFKR